MRGSKGTNDTISAGAAANIDDTPKVFAGRSGIDLYLAHILFSLNRWDWMISNLTNTGDIRIVPFARTIISKLPDKDVKVQLFKALNSDILAVKNTPNRSTIDKDQKILEICQNAISVVYDPVIKEYVLRETTVILPMTQDPTEEDDTDADSVQTPDSDD